MWDIWAKMEWNPKQSSLTTAQIARWPVWNNAVLATAKGLPRTRTLKQASRGPSTKTLHASIRHNGYTSFNDIRKGNRIMKGTELHNTIHRQPNVIPIPHITCAKLTEKVKDLWQTATAKWLDTQSNHNTTTTTPPTPINIELDNNKKHSLSQNDEPPTIKHPSAVRTQTTANTISPIRRTVH